MFSTVWGCYPRLLGFLIFYMRAVSARMLTTARTRVCVFIVGYVRFVQRGYLYSGYVWH